MSEIADLIERLNGTGRPVFWQGPVPESALKELDDLLSVAVPPSFREFLKACGGGGVIGSEISGIEDGDPGIENKGTVWGDTVRCRQEYALPKHLIVFHFGDDEVCWCLDSRAPDAAGEYPAISYSVFTRKIDARIAPTFRDFFRQYVELRTQTP